jgi:hypothetical protein
MRDKQVCPRCGDTDIGLDTADFKSFGLGGPSMYRCRNCVLTSPVFPVMDETTVKDFQGEKLESSDEKLVFETDEKKTSLWLYLAPGVLITIISPTIGLGVLLL